MCGIAGMVAREPVRGIGSATLRLTRALGHRGPDGEGFWHDTAGDRLCASDELERPARIVLGHRRLSIVDVEGGHQPMSNERSTVWVSFNGEIYNQIELRRDLERAGHRFRTRCDTEVLVHGWEEWREGLFGRLNGIFAFALVDTKTQEVVLARDPVGVKPLFIGTSNGCTWWSSELAAASAAGVVAESISHDALKLFFTFRFIPSPWTIYDNAWKLPPGHFTIVTPTQAGAPPQLRPFSSAVSSSAMPTRACEWREAMMVELEAAVDRQLMADVPVGCLLSGGVDSSLVTQTMARQLSYPPVTFGIGFPAQGAANEAIAAQRAADELGVPHRSVAVDEGEYVRGWPATLKEIGEPLANAGALLVSLLCREVTKTHKVVLSGQGADEPLGGYPRHAIERLHKVGRAAPSVSEAAIRLLRGGENGRRLGRALNARDRLDRYVEIFSVLPAERVDELVIDSEPSARELARHAISRWTAVDPPADGLNELLGIDVRMSLADDLLLVADHFSMRESVELRVPFLDLQFVELVERMPSRYKVSRLGERKWLYRQGARRSLPRAMGRRLCGLRSRLGTKSGFDVPLGAWFESDSGLLIDHDAWLAPLREFEPLSRDALAKVVEPGASTFARERSALFSLSNWLPNARSARA